MKSINIVIISLGLSACVSSTLVPEHEPISQAKDQRITLVAPNDREVSVRYIEPENCQDCPLIIFSHGANATYNRYDRYLLPLSELGYRIAAPNHVDSEAHPNRDEYAPEEYLPMRMQDYALIAEFYKPSVLIAAGHSFGALVAQLAGGAQTRMNKWSEVPVPVAVVALSPPGPIDGFIAQSDWVSLNRPHLVVTGTNDVVPGIADDWQAHLASYQATPSGLAFALVYDDMDHYMNGAYGRETESSSPSRSNAMSHLLSASHTFLQHALSFESNSSASWVAQTKSFVKAKSK